MIGAAVSLGGGVPAAVHYIGHDKVSGSDVQRRTHRERSGLGGFGTAPGNWSAEYHDRTNHVFIMVEGEATLVVGGTMVEPKRTAPYQMRAPRSKAERPTI